VGVLRDRAPHQVTALYAFVGLGVSRDVVGAGYDRTGRTPAWEDAVGERISARQFHEADGTGDWRLFPEGAYAFFRSQSFGASVRLVEAIGRLAASGDEPDIDIRGDGVTVLLRAFKREAYGLTQDDLKLAAAISTAAAGVGCTAEPTAIQSLSIIPGSTDRRAILPFWRAVLAYDPRPDSPDEDLVDRHDRGAPFWFENMEELRSGGGGTVHVVVWVPWDGAESRVAAGVSAGGRVIRQNVEERFWTLADAAGNEVDIAMTTPPER
jgi:4a-hydroxytetrahydrobiopterin dehydratase